MAAMLNRGLYTYYPTGREVFWNLRNEKHKTDIIQVDKFQKILRKLVNIQVDKFLTVFTC